MRKRCFKVNLFNKKILSIIIRSWLALLGLILLSDSVYAQGPIEVLEELQISVVNGQGSQDVSDDIVVFENDGDIYGHNLVSAGGFPIATHSVSQSLPRISGDTIVWMDQRNGNWDIYGHDLAGGGEFQLTTNAAAQMLPDIDGNNVVWVDWRNGGDASYGWDIYGYNLASKKEFRVTSQSVPLACPAISGNIVVWSDRRSGMWELYGKYLGTDVETQLGSAGASSPHCPAISSGVIVVGHGNSVTGINLSGTPFFETTTLSYPVSGRPAIDGNLVVWQERSGDVCLTYPCASIIVGYDIKSGHKFIIPQGVHEAWHPAISNDIVVWRDHSSAFDPLSLPSPSAVFASKLLRTAQFQADATTVLPGEHIIYTITLAEASGTGTMRSITNPLPPSVILDVPSLWASSGSYGYTPNTRAISWAGVVSSASPVTITYQVQIDSSVSFGEYIINTAIVSDQTSEFTCTATTWIARQTYLPVIRRDGH